MGKNSIAERSVVEHFRDITQAVSKNAQDMSGIGKVRTAAHMQGS